MPNDARPPKVFQQALAAHQAGRLSEAERGYRATIRSFPTVSGPYANLATVLIALGKPKEAEAAIRAGLRLMPTDAALVGYLSELRGSAGDWNGAEEVVRGALARRQDPTLALLLGEYRLAAGDYVEGWPLYVAGIAQRTRVPNLTFPEWKGEPVGSLLLLPDQGFGDQIMFARYVPMLRARGITPTLICSPALARLFEPLGVELIVPAGPIQTPRHDAWARLGSLAAHFGTTVDAIPPPIPVAAQLSRAGRVGIVTGGNPSHRNDKRRSLPPNLAGELLSVPGAISLAPEQTGARDFQDTANLIAGLDVVVTVDTAAAHLAGSMGKPTWVLLPSVGTDWRWLRERDDSPWYPSVRLFRQRPGDTWGAVVQSIVSNLSSTEQRR